MGFPFIPVPRSDETMDQVRRAARRAMFAEKPGWQCLSLRVLMTLAWPLGAVTEVLYYLSVMRPDERPKSSLAWAGRGYDMLALAVFRNVPPREYHTYRLHQPDRRTWITDCLYAPEGYPLLSWLNRRNGADNNTVQDKAHFADLCRRHGLPCITTLAVFRDGSQLWPTTPFIPALPLLWAKDLTGSLGAGAARWRLDAEYYHNDDRQVTLSPKTLARQWLLRDCLIQPCLTNHPALAALSDGTLVDFRVVTGIHRDGRVEVVATLGHLPCGGPSRRRYITGAIDKDSQRLISPTLSGFQIIKHHPDTGAEITAQPIPFWRTALELVVNAHKKVPEFSRFVFLGWDVAITADGPLLIETNSGWGAFNHQRGAGVPLGWTCFPGIVAEYLDFSQQGDAACG
ncbi:hypothetical protein EBB_18320 [Methylomonas sp. EbB]|uniref:Alpha-L-glutamate ligase-related protein ATP-grasp domain-containing protein n=2 Tax=Methylomonas fluvii TaxID=1854564 RepID=A0ABR9DH55_9GAMM|nr:hypothetical protein [Methylomonas fluvii]